MIPDNYFSVADDDRKWFYDSLKNTRMERTIKQLQPFIEGYDFSNEPLLSMDSF